MSRISRHRHDRGTWVRGGCLTLTWLPPLSIEKGDLQSLTHSARRDLSRLCDFFTIGEVLLRSQLQLL